MNLPRLYPIIDAARFASTADPVGSMVRFAEELIDAGVTLIQYRDKSTDVRRALSCARELRRVSYGRATLIINDRVDLCIAAGGDGVHLGQDDLPPVAARRIFDSVRGNAVTGREQAQPLWIGFSTHNLHQVREADSYPVDYIAVGPVFSTASKINPDPVIGLQGVRRARRATAKPLVAIGGITRQNCLQAREAGADSVAVISDLLESPQKAVEVFLRVLG
jgi:thiamine-phosphate pyrophosphorylase